MKYLLLSLLLVGSLASAKDITREYEGELPSPDCKVYRDIQVLKANGAKRVTLYVTHDIFSQGKRGNH